MTDPTSDNASPLWKGIGLALGSALLFGASAPLAKQLLTASDPVVLAGLLYIGAGIGLTGVLTMRALLERRKPRLSLRREQWPWLAGMIATGGIAGPVLLMLGLAQSDAASASLLLNVEGLATMVIAWVVFHENVDRRLLLGAAAILSGAIWLSWDGSAITVNLGAVLVMAACLAWGIDNNLTRHLSGADPMQLVVIKGLVAGTITLAAAWSAGAVLPPWPQVGWALILGFVSYGLSITLFVLALRHLGAARTGAYFSTAPFVGAVIAVTVFDAPMTLPLLGAGFMMALGVWLHISERHDHLHTHEGLEHTHSHVHDAHHDHEHGPLDPVGEPHTHRHAHARLVHAHPHYPDLHHRHDH